MRFPSLQAIQDRAISRRAQWHIWFAWRPVRLAGGVMAWLEPVERRGGFDHRKNTGRAPPWRWEYRHAA